MIKTIQFYNFENGEISKTSFSRPVQFGEKSTDETLASNGVYRLWIDSPPDPEDGSYLIEGNLVLSDNKVVRTDTWHHLDTDTDIIPKQNSNQQLIEGLSNPFTAAFVKAMDKAIPDHDILELLRTHLEELASPPTWDKSEHYSVGDLVTYDNRKWIALPDVADFPPDDVFEELDATGGWMPLT